MSVTYTIQGGLVGGYLPSLSYSIDSPADSVAAFREEVERWTSDMCDEAFFAKKAHDPECRPCQAWTEIQNVTDEEIAQIVTAEGDYYIFPDEHTYLAVIDTTGRAR